MPRPLAHCIKIDHHILIYFSFIKYSFVVIDFSFSHCRRQVNGENAISNFDVNNSDAHISNKETHLFFRLGLASRPVCEEALAKSGWSVQMAASNLLENT